MAIASSMRSRTVRGLAYAASADVEVHVPVGADGETPVVVVLRPQTLGLLYGWRSGQILAGRGLVAIVALVRPGEHALRDAAKACAWARDNARRFGGDPEQLFVYGRGKGAGLAAVLALDPRWLAEAGAPPPRGAVGYLGLYDSEELQVSAHARPDAPPLLLVADREDRGVGRFARALRTVGGKVAEIRCPGLHSTPFLGLWRALQLRLIALNEVERFIRLRSLDPVA